MIKINLYLVICNGQNTGIKAVSVFILQWNNGIYHDMFLVKLTIYAKDCLVKFKYMLGMMRPISLF